MLAFIKKYWPHLLTIIGGLGLSTNYFFAGKTWMGLIWLTFAMVYSVRLYQQYQRDQKHKK